MPESGVITRPSLVLASRSPQRLELLHSIGVEPVVRGADVDETRLQDESVEAMVERLARSKAQAVAAGKDLTIGADTLIGHLGRPIGKASSRGEARATLEELSGSSHQVLTAVAVVCNGVVESGIVSTEVFVRPLDSETIDWYLGSGEWKSKAGSYAIQGLGSLLVERISGNYQNVVGLPLAELDRLLATFGRPLRTWMAEP